LLWIVPAGAERLPTRTFTTADGLPNNVVNRIVGDSHGYLWFCTREGLSRFDGQSFVNYGLEDGLPSAYVSDLLETPDGRYWLATAGGLVRFDPLGEPQGISMVIVDHGDDIPTIVSSPLVTVVGSVQKRIDHR
jgi:ligand-binding sensor domain-containing protein